MRLLIFKLWLLLSCLIASPWAFAKVTSIAPNTIIDQDTTYQSTTLDLNSGSFVVINQATLTIENSNIVGAITPEKNFLINVVNGKLNLRKNSVHLTTANIQPNPLHPPLYYAIKLADGSMTIDDNEFSIEHPYLVGLLSTGKTATKDIIFTNNRVTNLHGGIAITNSSNALVANNKFSRVSSSNVLIVQGSHHNIKNNTFIFSGNNNVGDAIDLFDSNNISIYKNNIFSGSCYSMVVLLSKNILIDSNNIVGGVTYAVYVSTFVDFRGADREFIANAFADYQPTNISNENIIVTNNYLAQNRFGLTANKVDGLTVKNNIFVQHFQDRNARRFWTNNDNLVQSTTNIVWEDNLYKEAYAQNMVDPNLYAIKWVTFPLHGGIIL